MIILEKRIFSLMAENYTRTGNNWLTRWGNRFSAVPLAGKFLTPIMGGLGTIIDAGQWVLKGKILSGATALATGTVSTIVNTFLAVPGIGMVVNWVSGVTTGKSVGTHARKLTEGAIGGLTGLVGAKPTVLRSYQAGIGSIGGMNPANQRTQSQPGYWANRVAQEQGRDPQQKWSEYVDQSRRDAAIAGGRA
jgi:hypothetical protein